MFGESGLREGQRSLEGEEGEGESAAEEQS